MHATFLKLQVNFRIDINLDAFDNARCAFGSLIAFVGGYRHISSVKLFVTQFVSQAS